MIAAMEGGSMASMVRGSRAVPERDLPVPRAMAPSMMVLGRPDFLAMVMREARRGLLVGSGPWTRGWG